MKHTLKITLLLVAIFFFSQIVGLLIVDKYIDYKKTTPEQRAAGNVTWQALPYSIERPQVEESTSYLFIIAAIMLGTVLLLILIKYKIFKLWKFWYFISVLLCLSIAFSAFIPQTYSFLIALVLSILKIFKPNIYVHNFTELFIYGGLAAIFVPIINIYSAIIILILISAYDIWAVFKSKHMIKMATFQTDTKMFAGLSIPYTASKKLLNKTLLSKKSSKLKTSALLTQVPKNAILGGGDVGFPLIFAGVVMKSFGFYSTLIISAATTIALFLLLTYAKENKFYPAMPVLSLACFIGYALLLIF